MFIIHVLIDWLIDLGQDLFMIVKMMIFRPQTLSVGVYRVIHTYFRRCNSFHPKARPNVYLFAACSLCLQACMSILVYI